MRWVPTFTDVRLLGFHLTCIWAHELHHAAATHKTKTCKLTLCSISFSAARKILDCKIIIAQGAINWNLHSRAAWAVQSKLITYIFQQNILYTLHVRSRRRQSTALSYLFMWMTSGRVCFFNVFTQHCLCSNCEALVKRESSTGRLKRLKWGMNGQLLLKRVPRRVNTDNTRKAEQMNPRQCVSHPLFAWPRIRFRGKRGNKKPNPRNWFTAPNIEQIKKFPTRSMAKMSTTSNWKNVFVSFTFRQHDIKRGARGRITKSMSCRDSCLNNKSEILATSYRCSANACPLNGNMRPAHKSLLILIKLENSIKQCMSINFQFFSAT